MTAQLRTTSTLREITDSIRVPAADRGDLAPGTWAL